jgi:catechol 2,3-dioxygenase-like lactoylglutathione lyase family enzyme
MKEIKYHSTAVFVKNIEASKKFYTKMLGQEVAFDFGKNVILKCGITLWEVDPNHIIPEKLGKKRVVGTGANCFELYFETEDIEKVFKKLSEKGIEMLHALHEEPWGQKTMRFYDPDRHLIEVGERLEHFVRRLHLEGRTPEQVAEKTSIPLNEIRDWIYR